MKQGDLTQLLDQARRRGAGKRDWAYARAWLLERLSA